MTALFDLSGVCVDVAGGRRILDEIHLQLPKGRMTALLGHNGSGKSTLLKVLARQVAPDAGRVVTLGRAQGDWAPRDHAQAIAYLPQYTPAAEGMTVADLVVLGRYPWLGALRRPGPQDRAAVAQAIAECGLAPLAQRLVDTLSGGERQRAWLAMMIAQGAETLLLDEPISALDIAHQVEVLSLVRGLASAGRSVVLVLHDVNMAAHYCDHVIALKSGRLIFEGSPADLMTPARLDAIYGIPMDVLHRPHRPTIATPI